MPFLPPYTESALPVRADRRHLYLDFELFKQGDGISQLKIDSRHNAIRFVTNDSKSTQFFNHSAAHCIPSVDLIQMLRLGEFVLHSKKRQLRLKVPPISSIIFIKKQKPETRQACHIDRIHCWII